MRYCPSRQALVVALAIALLNLVAAPLAAGSGGEFIFTVADPKGDDHGDGTLVYPISDDMGLGDLDLVSFSASGNKDGTVFEATFARAIRRPTRRPVDDLGNLLSTIARYGFYTFNIDVYIDTDRKPGSGRTAMAPGRLAEVQEPFAWEKAVILTPRPEVARSQLRRILVTRSKQEAKAEHGRLTDEADRELDAQIAKEIDGAYYFPTIVNVTNRKIRFFVPSAFLGGVAADSWAYVVAVTGGDLVTELNLGVTGVLGDPLARLMNLAVHTGQNKDAFGSSHADTEMLPPIVDAIVPDGASQERLLADYDVLSDRHAALPGVVPAQAK